MSEDNGHRRFTADIVSAYVGNHRIEASEIPGLIGSVHRALSSIGTVAAQPEEHDPAISIKRSVQPDRITCLDCGWHGKMVKRHLKNSHGLTPEQYRARWRLPLDYPMTASNYSKTRSALAKKLGLGLSRTPTGAAPAEPPVTTSPRGANAKTGAKAAPKPASAKSRARKGTDAKSATA